MKENKFKWLLFCLVLVIITSLLSGEFIKCHTSTLMVPERHADKATTLAVAIRDLTDDGSIWNYSNIITATNIDSYNRKCTASDYVVYAKEVSLSDYGTFEDVCVQLFLNKVYELHLNGKESTNEAMPLSWYDFYDTLDISTVNQNRLRFKCEMIAQRWGMTTYGYVSLSEDYFSVNIYPYPLQQQSN